MREMTEYKSNDRNKLSTNRHILTDKNGVPISVVISSDRLEDIKR